MLDVFLVSNFGIKRRQMRNVSRTFLLTTDWPEKWNYSEICTLQRCTCLSLIMWPLCCQCQIIARERRGLISHQSEARRRAYTITLVVSFHVDSDFHIICHHHSKDAKVNSTFHQLRINYWGEVIQLRPCTGMNFLPEMMHPALYGHLLRMQGGIQAGTGLAPVMFPPGTLVPSNSFLVDNLLRDRPLMYPLPPTSHHPATHTGQVVHVSASPRNMSPGTISLPRNLSPGTTTPGTRTASPGTRTVSPGTRTVSPGTRNCSPGASSPPVSSSPTHKPYLKFGVTAILSQTSPKTGMFFLVLLAAVYLIR